jgi:hypothetical protein
MAQIPVGEKFYLFRQDATRRVDPATDHLLITAHGGYMNLGGPLGSSNLTVPSWTRLHFYAPHGSTIANPGIYDIMKGEYQVLESAGPGDSVTNYSLSKFQGRHGDASETYQSISKDVARNADQLSYQQEIMTSGNAKGPGRNFAFNFDVLTVRNRRLCADPSLKEALETLARHGYRYENIHCSFCRSGMLGDSPGAAARKFGS